MKRSVVGIQEELLEGSPSAGLTHDGKVVLSRAAKIPEPNSGTCVWLFCTITGFWESKEQEKIGYFRPSGVISVVESIRECWWGGPTEFPGWCILEDEAQDKKTLRGSGGTTAEFYQPHRVQLRLLWGDSSSSTTSGKGPVHQHWGTAQTLRNFFVPSGLKIPKPTQQLTDSILVWKGRKTFLISTTKFTSITSPAEHQEISTWVNSP